MARYIARRILLLLLTLLVTSVIVFALTQLLPGDIARLILGREARPEAIENLREQLGLNLPVTEQYLNWLSGFISGDWGNSFGSGNPAIRPLVFERVDYSMRLALLTLLISVPLSIVLGVAAALRENTWVDTLISLVSLSVVGLPEFVTGLLMINIFALGLAGFPPARVSPRATPSANGCRS